MAAVLSAPSAAATRTANPGLYVVDGVRTALERSAVAATGAAIVEVDHASVVVSASESDLRRLRELRHPVSVLRAPPAARAGDGPAPRGFHAADSGFHTYQEVSDETASIAAAYPSIVSRQSIGRTFQGRDIWALKVSDNVGADEAEPEVLFTHNQHAREHLTVEMAMYLLDELTTKYATDARIRNVVDTREIWIIPTINPDGAEFDVATGSYAGWRKNRQPNPGFADIGTDLNRNWGFQWGCCGGSSPAPASETYRGPAAFSAPETLAVSNFVASRRIGGAQQIKASIDFHSFGEQILWPYGYTLADTAPNLTRDQRDAFATLAQVMGQANQYTPMQSSDLYLHDGTMIDWLWGTEGVFAFTFEMSGPGFYPPDDDIPVQTARNREPVLRLLEIADCVYRAIGRQAQYCGLPGPAAVASIAPGALDFGSQGVEAGVSAPRALKLVNAGDAPLRVAAVQIGGRDAVEFVKAEDDCSFATVPAGSSCSIAVGFDPTQAGPRSAEVTFAHDAAVATVVALRGSGTEPASRTPPPAPPLPVSELATLVARRVNVAADGSLRLRMRCRAATATRCRGAVVLRARTVAGARRTVIARAALSMTAGTHTTKLRLRVPARAALRRRAALATSATVTTRRASGDTVTRTARLTLLRRR